MSSRILEIEYFLRAFYAPWRTYRRCFSKNFYKKGRVLTTTLRL
jgi:hypothetical protein